MRNYIGHGRTIKAAVAADVVSGDGVVVGELFGLATTDITSGTYGHILISGQVLLPAKGTDTFTAGVKVYWDATEGYVTTTSSGNKLAGYFVRADGANAVVRLPL